MTGVSKPSQARGKVAEIKPGGVVFKPAGTTYELHLGLSNGVPYAGPLESVVSCTIGVRARKVYTVPSGGNFIQPIYGPPRVIQGRVRAIDGNRIVVHAGTPIVVTLPEDEHAIDLNNGGIAEGALVNVIAFPGATATFEG
jgi:hypothetical protein